MILFIILSVLAIMLASLVGVVFVWKGFSSFVEKNSHYLTTFAAGVFTLLALAMTQETFSLSQNNALITISSIIFGIIIIEVITRILPHSHHHHTLPPKCADDHTCIDAKRMILSDTFHNIGDGILIVGAFMIDIHVGIVAAIGIFLHELVQEISEFFVFKEAGYSTKKALGYNFLISTSTLIGVALALTLSSIEWLIAPLMGFAAGGFIYALIRDLLPHTIGKAKKNNEWLRYGIVFLSGIGIMLLVNNITPHSHEDEHTSSLPENHIDEL